MIYFFVEGFDDSTFINKIIIPKISNYYIKVIEYAQHPKKYINGFLKTIKAIPNDDYLFLADTDNKAIKIRKNEILTKYKLIEENKIFFSVKEIECWYLAGISEKIIKECGISVGKIKKIDNTEEIDKEYFTNIFKQMNIEPDLVFKLKILNCFDIKKATKSNNSFKNFVDFLTNNYAYFSKDKT